MSKKVYVVEYRYDYEGSVLLKAFFSFKGAELFIKNFSDVSSLKKFHLTNNDSMILKDFLNNTDIVEVELQDG